jgi:hypothetical protein
MDALLKRILRKALRAIGLTPKRSPPFLSRVRPFTFSSEAIVPKGSHLLRPVSRPAPSSLADIPEMSSKLGQLWQAAGKTHKWPHYFPIYEETLERFIGTPIRILEIGVSTGGSLRMWRSYLGDASLVVGIDINSDCAQHDDPENGINVRIGSQADPEFLRKVAKEFGPFDAIIDDGSHMASHIATSFKTLFENALKPGGVYLIEDTHALYWERFRDANYGLAEITGELIDLMHSHYWMVGGHAQFLLASAHQLKEVTVPAIAPMIRRIEVTDSVLAVHKAAGLTLLPANVHI